MSSDSNPWLFIAIPSLGLSACGWHPICGRLDKNLIVQVNGVNVLTVEYERETRIDRVLGQSGDAVLAVHYNAAGQVSAWEPSEGAVAGAELELDALGLVTKATSADLQLHFKYDRFPSPLLSPSLVYASIAMSGLGGSRTS